VTNGSDRSPRRWRVAPGKAHSPSSLIAASLTSFCAWPRPLHSWARRARLLSTSCKDAAEGALSDMLHPRQTSALPDRCGHPPHARQRRPAWPPRRRHSPLAGYPAASQHAWRHGQNLNASIIQLRCSSPRYAPLPPVSSAADWQPLLGADVQRRHRCRLSLLLPATTTVKSQTLHAPHGISRSIGDQAMDTNPPGS